MYNHKDVKSETKLYILYMYIFLSNRIIFFNIFTMNCSIGMCILYEQNGIKNTHVCAHTHTLHTHILSLTHTPTYAYAIYEQVVL